MNFNLPSTSKILNYGRHGDYFQAKILIDTQSVPNLKRQLEKSIGSFPMEHADIMPVTQKSISWWDLDNRNIEVIYENFFDEKDRNGTIPHELWAIISKNEDGKYYLYLVY